MKRFKQLADQIARALVEEGFTVHRYDAEKTDSVYLKLDWGACNTIRISDHAGYMHIKYRYNIGTWIEEPMQTEDTLLRFFYPVDQAERLICRCIEDRDARERWLGTDGYRKVKDKKKREARRSESGFWVHARKVKR